MRFSNEDRCVDAPLSLLKEVALVGGRGRIARGARIGLSEGYNGRFRVALPSSIAAEDTDGS